MTPEQKTDRTILICCVAMIVVVGLMAYLLKVLKV